MRRTWIALWPALLLGWALVPGCRVDSEVTREIGAVCDSSKECDDRCLGGARFPEGFCSLSCDDDDDCPDGTDCVALEGGVCLLSCIESAGCEHLGDTWACRRLEVRGGAADATADVCIGPEPAR